MFKKDVITTDMENLAKGICKRYPVSSAIAFEENNPNEMRCGVHLKLGSDEMTFYRDYKKTLDNLYEMSIRGWYIKDKEKDGIYPSLREVMEIFSQRVRIVFE
ncbi:hypothetical protein CN918_26070 [Priestia megaterium]|nr:hypothetical protein CN918_26070 [Priestia megaterium]